MTAVALPQAPILRFVTAPPVDAGFNIAKFLQTGAAMPVTAIDPDVFDDLRALDDGNGLSLSVLLQTFVDEGQDMLERIDQAAGRGDAAGVAEAAHYLRSGALTVGAHVVAGLCGQIVRMASCGEIDRIGMLRRCLRVHQRRAADQCLALTRPLAGAPPAT